MEFIEVIEVFFDRAMARLQFNHGVLDSALHGSGDVILIGLDAQILFHVWISSDVELRPYLREEIDENIEV